MKLPADFKLKTVVPLCLCYDVYRLFVFFGQHSRKCTPKGKLDSGSFLTLHFIFRSPMYSLPLLPALVKLKTYPGSVQLLVWVPSLFSLGVKHTVFTTSNGSSLELLQSSRQVAPFAVVHLTWPV
jgi:hypothetical protein